MAEKYYAIRCGKETGIYNTWDECKDLVLGFAGAEYKSFKTMEEARKYLGLQESDEACSEDAPKPPKGTMIAYVDGSYNDAMPAFSYGMIAFTCDETIRDKNFFVDEELVTMRNVAGEIKGSEAAMRLALDKGCNELHIYHDYEGIAAWCEGRWKTNKTGTIAYKSYYDSVKDKINITFHKVTGHSGDRYNDEADELAKEAFML
ncbi:MAG: RNase H [Lachnospiraceae bacterium]|nr:RNase H [Lachnospiraceae bacterium]